MSEWGTLKSDKIEIPVSLKFSEEQRQWIELQFRQCITDARSKFEDGVKKLAGVLNTEPTWRFELGGGVVANVSFGGGTLTPARIRAFTKAFGAMAEAFCEAENAEGHESQERG